MVKGYVILDVKGDCLARGLYWYHHEMTIEAYVHPADTIADIKSKMKAARALMIPGDNWFAPKTMIPATWSPDEGVRITGQPEPFPWED